MYGCRSSEQRPSLSEEQLQVSRVFLWLGGQTLNTEARMQLGDFWRTLVVDLSDRAEGLAHEELAGREMQTAGDELFDGWL